ncbi:MULTISPECIES: aldo/keto reductase [unclassified Aerococcus]|uniref:aldo/keto reductase n=2 Tax=unclassified Aerococcus TaxID=2618060 RepID=UPI0008B35A7B|nr:MULTISPECIES: aldo/keto reductase [unclassified Aerococcus]MDK6856605.1 aldo/keto reductase [Aerococcus sp. UMB7533]OFN01111.1 hypothetical protein HMPREF2626_02990 [Aerococcus sp. HMSC062A02]OHO46118.1 hypothetical protein HMPREF2705_00755 [Aerococcus sp. HMSC035B07]
MGHLEVSEVGMGCMGFSHGYGPVPAKEESIQAIRAGYEAGCTLFDTAASYGKEMFYPGHNEELLGQALAPFCQEVYLASKVHLEEGKVATLSQVKAYVRQQLEGSLQRLGTDYLDIYYLHRINEAIPLADVAGAMATLSRKA